MRSGGRIVFVVPCESIKWAYKPGDVNHHLYTWSPMCLGNLFTEAGFHVEESKPYIHKWRPEYRIIARIGGRKLFDFCSIIHGYKDYMWGLWNQLRIVAKKP